MYNLLENSYDNEKIVKMENKLTEQESIIDK